MSIKDLSGYDVDTHRSIVFHGYNSMTDMNLMMIGSTPLSQVTPKIVREEVAYGDGDLDLSRVDGELYFNSRTITYTFVQVNEYDSVWKPTSKNTDITAGISQIYDWLYKEFRGGDIVDGDIIRGHISETELYDYGYGPYKFTNASVTDVQVNKAMFNNAWVETLEVTFTCDPYLQSLSGERLELATFTDRSVTIHNTQTELKIYTNNRYWLNDFIHWFSSENATHITDTQWRYRIRIQYAGDIGVYFLNSVTINGNTYTIDHIEGQTTPIYFLDNDYPGEIKTSWKGHGYTRPTVDSNGYYIIDFVVTFTDPWPEETPPWIDLEWGVLREYSVPDQAHYIMSAYSKTNSATMYVNSVQHDFAHYITLPERPINFIHIRNLEFDGMYKLRYDTTIRRL